MISKPDDPEDGKITIKGVGLTKKFGSKIALNNLNFRLDFNYLGLLGPNGSGKTTLIKTILGLLKPTYGDLEISIPIDEIRVIPENPYLPQNMTINEWVITLEDMFGKNVRNVDPQTIFELNGSWKIKDLSAGQYRKAALLAIFYGSPRLFILDEPTNFLDIIAREKVLSSLKEHIEELNAALIITSHRTEEVRLFARKVMILKEGSILTKIDLKGHKAETLALEVKNEDSLIQILNKNYIQYSVIRNYLGKFIILSIDDDKFWKILDEFLQDKSNSLLSIRTIDKLEKTIDELIR